MIVARHEVPGVMRKIVRPSGTIEEQCSTGFQPLSWALVHCEKSGEIHPHRPRQTGRMPVLLCCRDGSRLRLDANTKNVKKMCSCWKCQKRHPGQ